MQKEIMLKEVILMDSEIMLMGNVKEGFLSYDTQYHLPISHTNRLLNQLQAQNPELCVADFLVAKSVDQNTTVFVLNARDLKDSRCELNWDILDSSLMQVRA